MPKKGYKQSPEHLEKNRQARLGKTVSEETKRKMSESKSREKNPRFGVTLSDETKAKISAATMGRNAGVPRPEHVRKAIGDAHRGAKNKFFGKPLPDELKAKISAATSGGKNHNFGKKFSKETKEKLAVAHRGLKPSEETLQKMRDAQSGDKAKNFGVSLPESTRIKISESRIGEKNPSWRGGISFEPYCQKFNREFKERVREYFGRLCVECGSPEIKSRHHVHHVNFNKMTCCDDTKPLFVSLCHSCHNKTLVDRDFWEEHFTEIINVKYNGKCFLTKEELLKKKCGI